MENSRIIISIIIIFVSIIIYKYFFFNKNEITLKNLRKHIEIQEQSNKPFQPIIINNVLTNDEIILIKSNTNFHDSKTVGLEGGDVKNEQYRVSKTCWYDNKKIVSKLIEAIDPKKSYANCELIQIVKYEKGGFFNPHFDTTEDPYNNYTRDFKLGGHREYTLMISITDPTEYEGGSTEFPNLNKSFKLKKGQGLLFRNIDKNRNMLKEFKHAGNPVISGVKQICNLWIHEKKYN